MHPALKTLGGIMIAGSIATSGIAVDKSIDPYVDIGPSYELTVQGEPVTIDKDTASVSLPRWGEEVITVSRRGQFGASTRALFQTDRTMASADGTESFDVSPVTDGVAIDLTLNEVPATNVFDFDITGWEDFDFFYQPPLTDEELARGNVRPDDVVGSYAVYHKTKRDNEQGGKNYETGKAYHIYRPKVIDADGNEIWGDLSFDNGVLSVTVDQQFLDSAAYPVKVDPTFGYTSQGATDASLCTAFIDFIIGSQGSAITGTLTDVNAYVKTTAASGDQFLLSLYNESSAHPGTSIVAGSFANITNTTYALKTTSLSTTLSGANYWATVDGSASGVGSCSLAYDTGGAAGIGATRDHTSGIWSTDSNKYSIYATYTAGGGGGGTTATTTTVNINGSGVIKINGSGILNLQH